ncbi:MAG: short-chain dehydrogenase, partial [Pseudonocardiales bacterium]|nr:short-chain dehydrogenase [Pseudonocardiales bacterium]
MPDDNQRTARLGMLAGKVVLVTGAASGIGRATCLLAADEDARALVATDRDHEGLAALESDLKGSDLEVATVVGELSDRTLGARLVDVAVDRFGGFDAAVNNAGIRGTLQPIAEMDDATFEEVIDVNLRSVYRCMRAQLPHLYQRGGGA